MIEVTIWISGREGDGVQSYLINESTDSNDPREYFVAAPFVRSIRRALTELETDPVMKRARITRIDIRTTPDKVLILES